MFATDEAISVVPRKKIMESDDNLSLQQSCTVKWTDRKMYAAELLFLGKF